MSRRLDDLLLQRGRMIERIATQRVALRNDFAPVATVLSKADSAVSGVHSFVDYIRLHPVVTSVAVGTLLVFKGKAVLRWAKRAFSFWQTWRLIQGTLLDLGGRIRS